MGIYLNSPIAYGLFRRECASKYYVDKSDILTDLVRRVELDLDNIEVFDPDVDIDSKYVAITRPNR